jgi:hypothetical protein
MALAAKKSLLEPVATQRLAARLGQWPKIVVEIAFQLIYT